MQLCLSIQTECLIHEDESVRLLDQITEEMNYEKLYKTYSAEGRKPAVEPKTLFKIITYAYSQGIYSSQEIERLQFESSLYVSITTEKGIQLRENHSFQVEGVFGVTKQDYNFKRFLTRGQINVATEYLLLAFGFNINKLHHRIQSGRIGLALFELKNAV